MTSWIIVLRSYNTVKTHQCVWKQLYFTWNRSTGNVSVILLPLINFGCSSWTFTQALTNYFESSTYFAILLFTFCSRQLINIRTGLKHKNPGQAPHFSCQLWRSLDLDSDLNTILNQYWSLVKHTTNLCLCSKLAIYFCSFFVFWLLTSF